MKLHILVRSTIFFTRTPKIKVRTSLFLTKKYKMIRFHGLCRKAQWCKMILALYTLIHLLTTKPYNMKTTIAILLFFQHEFAFCTKQQINGTIVSKKKQ
jgi:hypothetical protein